MSKMRLSHLEHLTYLNSSSLLIILYLRISSLYTKSPNGQCPGIVGAFTKENRTICWAFYLLRDLLGVVTDCTEEARDFFDDVFEEGNNIIDKILNGIIAVAFSKITKI